MKDTPDNSTLLLLHAALDDEIDAIGMIETEAKLAADPTLAAEYAQLVVLRDAIRTRVQRHRAPDELRARVISMAQTAGQAPPTASRRLRWLDAPYRALAASLMVGIVMGADVYGRFVAAPVDDEVQRAIVAGFVRGRLSGQPVDVATSDRHTVKPWLASKIAGATTVVNLESDGFPLVGGRIDVIGKTPVATLVYQRHERQIALSELPASAGDAPSEPSHQTRDGFSILRWTEKDRLYEAVSDLPPAELDSFSAAFRRAAVAERENAVSP